MASTSSLRDTIAPLKLPAYTFLSLTLVLQVGDFFLVSWPPRFDVDKWRFNAFGTLASTMGNLFLLVLLMYALALVLNHRVVLRVLGTLAAVVGIGLVVASALFVLDALQLSVDLKAEQIMPFRILWLAALTKILCMALICGVFAFTGLRALRVQKAAEEKVAAKADPLLIR